jgi:diaminopimelate decarboxylase
MAEAHAIAALTEHRARLLAHRAGGTPLYVYARDALDAAVARVRAASVEGAQVHYSLKANPHAGVVTHLAALVDGFDVCSLTEMETALHSGAPPGRVLFTGPAKSRREAAAALAAGVAVTIESPLQAVLFGEVARELDIAGRAVVRLNAPYPARQAGGPPAPNHFGVGEEDLAEVIDRLRASSMTITGLHLFWGSQHFDAGVIAAARRQAMDHARGVVARFDLDVDTIGLGGGIGMPWCDHDPPVDWAGLEAVRADRDVLEGAGGAAIVCEYGRSIAGPSGTLITAVLDTKTIGDTRYVLVDAGMNHVQIAGRLIAGGGRGEPLVRAPRTADQAGRRTVVTGPLCSQLDVLADGVPLPDVEVGDLLTFSGVGAYGPSFSPAGFLSREPIREIVV